MKSQNVLKMKACVAVLVRADVYRSVFRARKRIGEVFTQVLEVVFGIELSIIMLM